MEHAIWTEKYRPQTFEEIRGQKDIVEKTKAFVEKKNMPHLLFSGPAGVGKTTLALVIARKLFGQEWHQNFLELNASDERGIDVVRVKVKDFARTRSMGNVPFKIIYLDECLDYDSLIVVQSHNGIEKKAIGEFIEKDRIEDYRVLSVDDCGEVVYVPIVKAIRMQHHPEEGFYQLKIHEKGIKITGNHLLITPQGWKPVRDLKEGDLVLCPLDNVEVETVSSKEVVAYALVGLPQEIKKKERYIAHSPEKLVIELLASYPSGLTREELTKLSGIQSTKLSSILSPQPNEYYLSLPFHGIVEKNDCRFRLKQEVHTALDLLYHKKRGQNTRNQEYIRTRLFDKGLFPLRTDKAAISARILGHLFSDGGLSLKTKQVFFSGKEEDLQSIKQDLNELGYYALGNVRHQKWKKGECWSFGAYAIELLSLFYSLGAPVGKKTDSGYTIPDWIMNGSPSVKKEFLSAFFGGEGSKPKFQGRTIKPIVAAQSKREDLEKYLVLFLHQIKSLLSDFSIDAKVKMLNEKYTRSDSTTTIKGMIWITNSRANMMNFLEKVGYAYSKEREDEGRVVLQYLRWKQELGTKVYSFKQVPHYEEWKQNCKIGNCAYHYITGKRKLADPDYIYCLSTANQKFLADNVIVHNCDALTREAQQALRRTMENYTATTRFILSCNYSSKIIDPIQSRCTVFRFSPLDKKEMAKIVETVAKAEKLKIDEKAIDALCEVAEGDVRRIENVLQACASIGDRITEDAVYNMASIAKPKEIKAVLEECIKGNFLDAKNKLLSTMLNYGLSGLDVIKQVQKEVWSVDIPAEKRLEMVKMCGEIEFRLVEGSDEFIQLEALLAAFCTLK